MLQVLSALQYSHAQGVVHRDIKPANIMVSREGTIKIADFGVARIESSQLTQTGDLIGTPSYMSPEQFAGETADPRTDLYAASVVFYELLTRKRPFEGSNNAVIMHRVFTETPPAPSIVNPLLSTALDGDRPQGHVEGRAGSLPERPRVRAGRARSDDHGIAQAGAGRRGRAAPKIAPNLLKAVRSGGGEPACRRIGTDYARRDCGRRARAGRADARRLPTSRPSCSSTTRRASSPRCTPCSARSTTCTRPTTRARHWRWSSSSRCTCWCPTSACRACWASSCCGR